MAKNIKQINEAQLKAIIAESILDTIADKLGGVRSGTPSSIKDVIEGNHWKVGRVQKPDNNTRIVQVFSNYNPFANEVSDEELVEDLNIYFQDNHKNLTASIVDNNGERGVFIKIARNL